VFDIRRDPNRHVAFGHGIHFCIGAPLARLESKIALPMILQQLPGLQRVPDAPIVANTGIVFAIKKLLITWDYQQEMVGAR
jgi:cytochrome P450